MPGGFGGMDLYMIRKMNDTIWSAPINLGARVNTALNEVFPTISKEGTLYFASNGQRKGKGGLDIYSLEVDKRNAALIPLGAPFNTEGDDFGLMFFFYYHLQSYDLFYYLSFFHDSILIH